jgi:hypothetical protein
MKTINSLSGGKTSSYIAANYPADYNIFSLVRTTDKSCIFPDAKLRQEVSDRIGAEFIGTLEEDTIIYTMLDLEQFIGQKITWISGKPFDEIIKKGKLGVYLPNKMQRFCTIEMKVEPIAQWCYDNTELPVEMRIGFRANEQRRAISMIEKSKEGMQHFKFKIGKHKNGNNKWKELPYRTLYFPLIEDNIYKDNIDEYWNDKPVRFAYMNNCIGCFHRSPIVLKHMSNRHPEKFEWFINQEIEGKAQFKTEITYNKIKNHKSQLNLFDEDFNDCDSGYCGL